MIICDIDGCLFDNSHRSHLIPDNRNNTHSWDEFNQACKNDVALTPVINFVKFLANKNNKSIVFVTARGESAREQTLEQLFKFFHDVEGCRLIMRDMDDHRPSVNYKRSVFHQLSDNFSKDTYIFEDHPAITAMVKVMFPQVNLVPIPSFDCTLVNDK